MENAPNRHKQMAWIQQINKICCPHIYAGQVVGYQMLDTQHAQWELEHKWQIRRLLFLIRTIREVMSNDRTAGIGEHSKASLVWNRRDGDSVRLYRANCNDMGITEEIKRKFWAIGPEEPFS
jgi:hypothetical protein